MILARHQQTTDAIRDLSDELARLGRYHSLELPDGTILPGLQSMEQLRYRIGQYPIPSDLSGKRVLDIGAWDGWFSFEMERRGATVVATDVSQQPGFWQAKGLLNSNVEYLNREVYRLDPAEVGYFDIVMFFGVLYHLKHPLLALERVCELTTDTAYIESLVIGDAESSDQVPSMEFYEGTELAGQFDNWVGPNVACLLAFCRTAGFARVELQSVHENRAHVTCYRKWPTIERIGAGPEIVLVENPWTRDHNFSANRDDYLTIWFKSDQADLNCHNVFVQVGPYGSRPVNVHSVGGHRWQTDCKLPPGLPKGWHDVNIGVNRSAWSNRVRIPIDLAQADRRTLPGLASGDLEVTRVIDGKTYEPGRVRVSVAESSLSAWVAGLYEGARLCDVSLRLDGADLPAIFVSDPDLQGLRQVNAMVPIGTVPGTYVVSVAVGGLESKSIPVTLVIGEHPIP